MESKTRLRPEAGLTNHQKRAKSWQAMTKMSMLSSSTQRENRKPMRVLLRSFLARSDMTQ